jgi:polar amino acid transport system permease protein
MTAPDPEQRLVPVKPDRPSSFALPQSPGTRAAFLQPHRLVLIALAAALVLWCAVTLRWDWLPTYAPLLVEGLWTTIWLLVVTTILGFTLAVPLGLAQAAGPWYLATPARIFCTIIRGTPLLLQIWLLYYGLGSLFPQIPGIRQTWLWPYLREAWPYAVLALSLSYAGYEGEVMRGAFAGVPRGQLETGQAYGMGRFTLFRRIWLPQATRNALPTLAGETILQMKATPLVATITIMDTYAVTSRVRQDLLIVYEPLLLLAVCYLALAGLIALGFSRIERRGPGRARR